MKRKLTIAFLAILVLGMAVFGWLWFAPCRMGGGCAPVSELEKFQAEGSALLDMNGRPFGSLATFNRTAVTLDSLPAYVPKAFLAVEDRRFYEHGGVDWKRFLGALLRNVKAGGVEEGGSTITMQLARNLFPERLNYRERSLRRKLMEIRIARQIERAFPKPKILELYLNHIYLGQGAYGIDAASREYFGHPAARLTLAEAAVLGGLPVSPSRINPREDKDAALKRRDLVLREMAKAGYVPQAEADAAIATPLRLAREARTKERGSYFVERVRRELEEQMGDGLYARGLKVYTTYDPAAQKVAEEEVARQASAIESGAFGAFRHPTYASTRGDSGEAEPRYLQGSAVVMEVRTGEIRALVGGRDYQDSKYDRVFQAVRQPGSAFKPFVYLAALERGIAPSQIFQDAPVQITLAGGRPWTPRNYTGAYDGPITVRDALTRSKNTVTVRIAQDVGMSSVINTAHEMGITTQIPNVPSAALGAAEVKPIELVRAYAAFSSGGDLPTPHVVRRIEDHQGTVLWEADNADRQHAVDPAPAFVLTSMLRDVVNRGTGTPVRAAGFRGPAAGKTGTTNEATDVWFVGYTPDLVASVWFGFDQPTTIIPSASGGTLAAPVWGRIMARIYQHRPMPAEWVQPRGVTTAQVDRRTGQPVDASCPGSGATYTEFFVGSAPPAQGCMAPGQYPAMAFDSVWTDEEAGGYAYEPDTVGTGTDLQRRGIDWPQLEEQRRREAAGAPPLPPAAGTVTDPVVEPPARTGSDRARRRDAARTPVDVPPPADDGTGSGGSSGGSSGGGRRPRVLGTPVDGGQSTPPPTDAPPPPPPPPPAPPPASSDSLRAGR